jgi:hypothetical protein
VSDLLKPSSIGGAAPAVSGDFTPDSTTPDATALAAIDDAVRAISSVLGIEEVLQLIVDRVRELVEASYAALGIVGVDGRIERFITAGIDPHGRQAIGALPTGRGLLGLIIREGRSYRIPSIAESSPDDVVSWRAGHGPRRVRRQPLPHR